MIRYLIILFFSLVPLNVRASDQLAYYSDYFSFVGRDATGFVVFALDNNRGVDGEKYQAEHFGVFYGQHSGWIKLIGTGNYANDRHVLEKIPDSASFRFEGAPEAGMTIRSETNQLTLTIKPLTSYLVESAEKRVINWGAAGAVLYWHGRAISGRVIYEHLVHLGWNRLTRIYAGTWHNFQGLYLAVEEGDPSLWKDLYLRSEGDSGKRDTKGFATLNGWKGDIHSTRYEVSDTAFAFGLYRWPQRWTIELEENAKVGPAILLNLHQISRQNQGNWIIGGFAMSVVAGDIIEDGVTIPVVGFAELIK